MPYKEKIEKAIGDNLIFHKKDLHIPGGDMEILGGGLK